MTAILRSPPARRFPVGVGMNATMEPMKITKLEHAFVTIEVDGKTLVIDPGKFSSDLPALTGVVGIVLTHEHDDHTYPPHITAIRSSFPDVPIWTTAGAHAVLAEAGITSTVVAPGDTASAGPFALAFYGGRHAIIHSSIPQIDNIGVSVDDRFFYAGDSFALPGHRVEVLAVPSSAPWLKVAEVMDYVDAIHPSVTFPTHDALWSPPGTALANARIGAVTEAGGGRFYPLVPGTSIEF